MNRMIFIFLSIYFWAGALWQGYFAEIAYLISDLFLFFGLLVVICLKKEWTVSPIHIPILLIVLGYWVSVIYATDIEQAVLEASRVSALIPLSLLIVMVQSDHLQRLYRIWPWIGAVLTIAGIVLGLERNGRLESTLEYANALAIFALINIGICVVSYMLERKLVYLGLLTVNAVGLLLTFSRSVWVLWLIMAFAALVWFPQLRKQTYWIPIGLTHIFSLAIALAIKRDTFFFWQRVSSIQTKTSEFQIRLTYWKDSWGMIHDHFLGGTGGGGWNVLVSLYRSQEYFVRYVHNHYIQITLDIGIVGLLAFASWIVIFYMAGIRRIKCELNTDLMLTKGMLLFVTVLLLHAGFDFDLTFPFMFGTLVCLTVPLYKKTYQLRLSRNAYGATILFLFVGICWWGWLAIGYGYIHTANYHVATGEYVKAQKLYTRGEYMMPWSSSARYASAKGYVRQGNATGDASYYQLARDKLLAAKELVPEQKLYTDLFDKLPVNSTIWD